ncbi:hypothetical protein JOC85_001679 [Bacillus mesophilus]|nr:hypothetical protein [Bacillus mesophilus]
MKKTVKKERRANIARLFFAISGWIDANKVLTLVKS